MSDKGYKKYWTEVSLLVASGNYLGRSDLYAIYDNIDLSHFNPGYLPDQSLVEGTVTKRKDRLFCLAEKIWGITPEGWLKMENGWLNDARAEIGSKIIGGKDKISDVVSTEILLGLISAAKLVTENRDDSEIVHEACAAVNLILAEACAKGRTRLMRASGQSVYSVLKNHGLMFGLGGGKYLPNPTKSLAILLLMLNKDSIRSEVYLP